MNEPNESYSLMTWSRIPVHETPFQSQGSESKVFQLDKTLCGSSYTASLKVLSAQTKQKKQKTTQIFITIVPNFHSLKGNTEVQWTWKAIINLKTSKFTQETKSHFLPKQ